MSSRRGMSVLLVVCALAFAIGLVSLATHSLWRGSSRSLFGVQEHRELVNLCHSAIAETIFDVQTKLEQGASHWVDWCTTLAKVSERKVEPKVTREYCKVMLGERSALAYNILDVTLTRLAGLSEGEGLGGRLGVIEIAVTVDVSRTQPTHSARVTMIQRRAFWFSDSQTAFSKQGRHIEILRTPLATFLEYP